MARPAGVEPTTPSLEGWCSIQFELRARLRRAAARPAAPARKRAAKSGRGGEIRTPDILLPKQARYQAALHPAGVGILRLRPLRGQRVKNGDFPRDSLARPLDFWYQIAFATRRSRLGAAAQILPALPAEKRRGVHESQAARAFQEGSRGAEGGAVAGHRPDGPRDAGRRDRERKLIKKIDETIARIDKDDYGYCENCGVEIGLKRLEARPTATLCIDCKTLDELREKQVAK